MKITKSLKFQFPSVSHNICFDIFAFRHFFHRCSLTLFSFFRFVCVCLIHSDFPFAMSTPITFCCCYWCGVAPSLCTIVNIWWLFYHFVRLEKDILGENNNKPKKVHTKRIPPVLFYGDDYARRRPPPPRFMYSFNNNDWLNLNMKSIRLPFQIIFLFPFSEWKKKRETDERTDIQQFNRKTNKKGWS